MAVPAPRGAGHAAAFDAMLEHLEERELLTLTDAEAVARVDELGALLPANDIRRALRYRGLRCDWTYGDDPNGQLAYALEGLSMARASGDLAAQAGFHYCRAAAIETLGAASDEIMRAAVPIRCWTTRRAPSPTCSPRSGSTASPGIRSMPNGCCSTSGSATGGWASSARPASTSNRATPSRSGWATGACSSAA